MPPALAGLLLLWGGAIVFGVVYPVVSRLGNRYGKCPHCNQRTLDTHTSQLPETAKKRARKQITQTCRNCSYSDTQLIAAAYVSGRGVGNHHASGGSSGGGFSGGGFGGGSSGGGGGGADW